MRKVQLERFGGPEVLSLVDVQAPEPGPGQIRIRVCASGVNAVDWRRREGQKQGTGALRLPTGVGQDASGVVDQVGDDVVGLHVGDRVFGRGLETYAEMAVLSSWARVPRGVMLAEASAYPSVVETALRVLREVGVGPGQTLLVCGAAGGVGSAVLQISSAREIRVVGTASFTNLDHLRSLGALATTCDAGWVERVRVLGEIDAALDLAGADVVGDGR